MSKETQNIPTIHDVQAYLTTNEALHQALNLKGATVPDVRLLARGEYNLNFAFGYPSAEYLNSNPLSAEHPSAERELVFRVNLGSQMHLENQIEYEAAALSLLQSSGRTPQVFYVDGSKAFFGKGILIEQFLPGRPLDYTTDLPEAALILADIHSVKVDESDKDALFAPQNPLGSMLEESEAMFAQYRAWIGAAPEVCARIEGWFERARLLVQESPAGQNSHIISTEVNSGNFLINEEGQSYLVDWEKPLLGEAEQDLAHFLVPTTTFWKTDIILSETEIQTFIKLYRNAVNGRFDTSTIASRLPAYMALTCLRGVTWCAMALAQHETSQRKVADVYTLSKVRAYLEESFLIRVEESYFTNRLRKMI